MPSIRSSHSNSPRTVPCPQCGKSSIFDSSINPYRPFCSHRCKQIDLGAWSSESYRMPQPPEDPLADDEAHSLHDDTRD
ncbi:MAG: DNA gyrase inhibitor YacG [Brachymonas sp.]|nr:DNA gyrase inhibitor YacG [Brachymonas sp.]